MTGTGPAARRTVRVGALLVVGVIVAAGWASAHEFRRFRYGERSARGIVALVELVRAEEAFRDRTGAFASVEVTAASASTGGLAWTAPAGTGFTYRLTAMTTTAGEPAFAACAEADLDGDGDAEALVAFEPAADAQGALVAPAAPCRHARRFDRPLTYAGEAGPFRASPPGVF